MTNIKERGFSLQSTYAELYWKFPRFLLLNDKYKNMKDSSKIAYMLFKDRMSLSITNKWIDEDNMLYLQFSQKKLMELLNCYQGKVKSTLDDLEKVGLLTIVRGTFDPKKGENTPSRYYLLQPELESSDMYITEKSIENFDNTGYAEIARREETAETLDNTGYAEIARRSKTLDNTGYAEIAQDKDIAKTDTIKEDTTNIDTEKSRSESNNHVLNVQTNENDIEKLREHELLKHFAESNQEQSFLNTENLKLIALFSDSLLDAENIQGIILRAKKAVENKRKSILVIDESYIHNQALDIQGEIAKTLRRIYQKRQTDSTIENIDNYAFGSFKNLFDLLLCQIQEFKKQSNDFNTDTRVTLHDWLK